MQTEERDEVRLQRPVKEIWSQALDLLSKQMAKPSFEAWVAPAQLVSIEGSECTIATANEFSRGWLAGKHLEDIVAVLSQVVGFPVTVKVCVDPSVQADYTPSIASITVAPSQPNQSAQAEQLPPILRGYDPAARAQAANVSPKYTFDTFVVGSNNTFCHSAALAVATKPGVAYNPLFIHGGVGLGKTHIMHAIGNHILQHSPNVVVRYMTCEKFTNDLINALQHRSMIEFRKRYRQVDVLLMDDIQFIEGKESTQEEFFHTFNALRDAGRQIVICSDRPPKAIATLEERLRSRFEWGLIADIQAPDYETRLAILRTKCQEDKLDFPDDVLEFIAKSYTSNIRELEGALVRVNAYANLTGASLNLFTARNVLQPENPGKTKQSLTVERIIDAVASHYKLDASDLRSAKRSQDLVIPRHIAMYLAQEMLSMSLPRIGQTFGNRKHTSAKYACDKVKEEIAANTDIAEAVRQITRQLSV